MTYQHIPTWMFVVASPRYPLIVGKEPDFTCESFRYVKVRCHEVAFRFFDVFSTLKKCLAALNFIYTKWQFFDVCYIVLQPPPKPPPPETLQELQTESHHQISLLVSNQTHNLHSSTTTSWISWIPKPSSCAIATHLGHIRYPKKTKTSPAWQRISRPFETIQCTCPNRIPPGSRWSMKKLAICLSSESKGPQCHPPNK